MSVFVPFQDFSVDFGHCPEITVYTGCCLFPPVEQLAALWAENKKPLLSMLVEVQCSAFITELTAWRISFNMAESLITRLILNLKFSAEVTRPEYIT